MPMTEERRLAIRTPRGWAISVLHEAGAIDECEEAGFGTAPIRTPASARSTSLAMIRRQASLPMRR